MKRIYLLLAIALTALLGSCDSNDQAASLAPDSGNNGRGGSLARFAINGNHLYIVDQSNMNVFDISNPSEPTQTNRTTIGPDIETIFPRGNELFIGAMDGMYIYDVSTPTQPELLSLISHVRSCDPVVAQGDFAYVTLRSGTGCGFTNQLDIIDISDLRSPETIATYSMDNPGGLGIDGNTLFVCDNGLKVFDVTDKRNIEQVQYFDISARDVIPFHNRLLVITETSFKQYRYEGQELELLSELAITPYQQD